MEKAISLLNNGINDTYSQDSYLLEEKQEEMKVHLSKSDQKDIAIVNLKDNEHDGLWNCFSNKIDRDIADYIVYKKIGEKCIAYVIEMKIRKTKDNTKKATGQILSTYPLVNMIYEKITDDWTRNLKIIGVRLFGAPNTSKVSNDYKKGLPTVLENGRLPIASITLNKNGEKLMPLKKLFDDIQALRLN